uniref:ubiquitinyl hydrolase 1 n=1 Tax=Odontella aurita TaxID=265563 RepID=A0A7S4J0L6_9STRA|mmetsp:Transcript_35000/g.104390  ORF Transcript_35000/g.104390 Transcript_35000/m.104390 type:complete len:759 (+) Transcript_35000:206-2482(+)
MRPQTRSSNSGQSRHGNTASSSEVDEEDAATACADERESNSFGKVSDFRVRSHTGRRTRRSNAGTSSTASSAGGKAAARRANRQQREEEAKLQARRIILDLIDQAKYEALVDPYRGIYSHVDSGGCGFVVPSQNNGATVSETDMSDEDLARYLAAKDSPRKRNPWGRCLGVPLGGAHGFSLEEDRDGTKSSAVISLPRTGVGWVPSCSCPSVTSWCNEEVVKRRVKLKKERSSKSKKKGRGKGMEQGKPGSNKSKDESGMEVQHSDQVVQATITAKLVEVRRDPDSSFRCPCDYNPCCLGSLGGAVDDLWKLAMKERCTTSQNLGSGDEVVGENDGTNRSHTRGCRQRGDSNQEGDVLGNMEDHAARTTGHGAAVTHNNKIEEYIPTHAAYDGDDAAESSVEGEFICGVNEGEDTYNDLPMKVRRSVTVDIDLVRSYLGKFVVSCSSNSGCDPTVDECLDLLQQWHGSLLFPTVPDKLRETMLLSVPAGMRNLGATCYLNSQFQCLAQNPAFLRGVFSWQSGGGNGSNRMSRILSTMQHILARMVFGPSAIVCTDEFATALGIETQQQQDPNEFARLLFDRMHESFQKMAGDSRREMSGPGENGPHHLPQLLPSIFGGVYKFTTCCMTCGGKSSRSENFFDLTLPLCPPHSKSSSSGRTLKRLANGDSARVSQAMLDPRDTTLQACLDTYLQPEYLDGENMYLCGSCNAKRDAQRSVSFVQLPPVLNVQVARYVFDRKSLMKKKAHGSSPPPQGALCA